MRILTFVVFALSAGCSLYAPDLPAEPFLCGMAEPVCPDGFTCMDGGAGRMVCVKPNASVTDARIDSSACADDSPLEPNNDIQHAYQTPVDTQKKTIPYGGLSICPAGDKDTYQVTISTALENLEALVQYEPNGAVLQASILNSGGQPISNASPMGTNTIRAYTPNLPISTYYIQVYGPAGGANLTNNYKLTITVTGP